MKDTIKDEEIEKAIQFMYKLQTVSLMDEIFNDHLIKNLIRMTKESGKIKEIYTIDDCINYIKPSTFYIGAINRINKLKNGNK